MTLINDYYNSHIKTHLTTPQTFTETLIKVYVDSRKEGLDVNISNLFVRINQRIKVKGKR